MILLEANWKSKDEISFFTNQWETGLYEFSIDFSRFGPAEVKIQLG